MALRVFRLYRAAFSGLPRDIWLVAAASFVNRSGTMVLPFLALYLTLSKGLSTAEAGRLVGLYGIGAIFGAYIGGWLSDHIGPIRAQQTSLVLGGVGYLVLGMADGPWPLAFAILVTSAVVESFRPAVMSAVVERSPDEGRAKAFALLRQALNLGFAIGPALGGVLATVGYRWLFVVDALTSWGAAALLLLLPADPSGHERESARRGDRMQNAWRDLPFLGFLVLVVLLASALFQVLSTLPLYFREQIGLREDAIGLLLSVNALLIVAFEMVLIHLVQNRDRMLLSATGALLLCLGLGALPLGHSIAYIVVTIAIWTCGEMLSLPILNVIAGERASRGRRGQYMGLYTMAYSVAFVVAPVTGTWIYSSYGPETLWHSIGGLGALLAVAFLVLRRPLATPAAGDPARLAAGAREPN